MNDDGDVRTPGPGLAESIVSRVRRSAPRSWLLRRTPPRALLVNTPGGTEARLAVECLVRERGWRFAVSPAEANLLVVTGAAVDGFERYLDPVWRAIPAPRVRADVATAPDALTELERAVGELRDVRGQRAQARQAASAPETDHDEPHDDSRTEHHNDHGGHGEHHGGHGHDMGGMEMPGGIPMAERAEDRDGLMLDQLHVPLGPVLTAWPAGLVLDTTMQGDVLTEVGVRTVGLSEVPGNAPWTRVWRRISAGQNVPAAEPARQELARHLDACVSLLSVAGWEDAAGRARLLRDNVLRETARPDAARIRSWARRVRRSRTLRWLLSDVGAIAHDPGTPQALTGDALSRLNRWLDTIGELSEHDEPCEPSPQDGEGRTAEREHETRWTLDALPGLLCGSELAIARLIVASLHLDLDLLPAAHGVSHG
ncbi:hypothetical protein SAMN05216266_104105 [Amycolatopsis marina]|uniref:Uncharacterized protein n=1 Tax=Amycolatopsis marina TaxID=490629 RepID=A0A1I0XYC5_9PSEU|nr:hypothetical protein [Amycolatopsis marina]SFB05914.1 hypothetical protein SAMN05216266_104105 [Amycolatopsis marina]